ncbi:MAG: hypothetical protein AAGM04_11540, partial [Pseudomonadota bacterium]
SETAVSATVACSSRLPSLTAVSEAELEQSKEAAEEPPRPPRRNTRRVRAPKTDVESAPAEAETASIEPDEAPSVTEPEATMEANTQAETGTGKDETSDAGADGGEEQKKGWWQRRFF